MYFNLLKSGILISEMLPMSTEKRKQVQILESKKSIFNFYNYRPRHAKKPMNNH